jgi:rhodanese-related sulfurtransferase
MAVLTSLPAAEVAARIKAGKAVLVDIREPDEVAQERIAGSVVKPLSAFGAADLDVQPGRDVIYMCRSGARTGMNCVRLAASVPGEAFVLEGGLNGWKAEGLPTVSGSGSRG